jgi:outer membrane protein assembly factor BamB
MLLTAKIRSILLVLSIFFSISCNKSGDLTPDTIKRIVSFSLKKPGGLDFVLGDIKIEIDSANITITVPAGTDRSVLIPEITIEGISITPSTGVVQDFSKPVVYTVTAEDGSSISYTVTVKVTNPHMLYFGTGNLDNSFYGVDPLTGIVKWIHKGTASFAYSSPTYNDGVIYVGCIDSYVYAFEAMTGKIKWKYLLGPTGIESDAVYANGAVYVGCNDDYLYALDAETGQIKWKYLTGSNISASPVIDKGYVYFGSSDGKLYALDAITGKLKWAFQTGAMINQSAPELVDGVLYVGSRDKYLYAIDAVTGTQKWKFFAGISLEGSSPTVANEVVYIGGWYDITDFSIAGSLYAVNANNGQLVWEQLKNTGISSNPYVANGRIFVTADDLHIHALDAVTGAPIWKRQILPNSASPSVSNGVVYVGGGGYGIFFAFDAVTGAEKWKLSVPGSMMTSDPLIVTP